MALVGKTAVITGGSSGIGLATARLFAAEGAAVVVVGRDEERLRRTGFDYVVADLSHGAAQLAAGLHDRTVDVLFCNAGASNAPEVFDTTEKSFDAVVDVNLKSVFFTVTECFDRLADGASVILTSSVGFHRGFNSDPLYSAAKAGVRTLGRGFAAQPEFLRRRIRVNTISYGAVATPMTDHPLLREWAASNVPMGRVADPAEAAAPALFLAGAGSTYMTGAEIAVDGGLTQL
ncbi:SDR family NAD(P)-dependent oxidoreductase [Kutzneria chonburiensis]|uniref:SDR family NAD(P)-dependent oxidoreductase n=1 Tax=Kutzneria chonburiensis TaxID=1483604 RepID=A0ABV6MMG9_9PSEU|nr:SDR family oxidoreductase [Kutzneria chonburiensis]